jgi:voltage-gated potassium channel
VGWLGHKPVILRSGPQPARHDGEVLGILIRVFGARHRRNIAILLAIEVACILVGGALFAATQGLPVTTGWYWAITTATTVGYGDVIPHNAAGRVIASAVMLSTIPLLASVFALVTGRAAAEGLRRIMNMTTRPPDGAFRLLVGSNPAVPAILAELMRADVPVVLVADIDPATVAHHVHVVRGDPTEAATIAAARPQDAEQALVTGATDGDVLVTAVLLRKLAPDLTFTALVSSPAVREALSDLGVQQTLSGHELIAGTLATSLETPHAGEMMAQLVESGEHRLTEVDPGAGAAGKALSVIRDERPDLVLGLVHDGQFTLGVTDDPVVAAGDRLLVAQPDRRARAAAGSAPGR